MKHYDFMMSQTHPRHADALSNENLKKQITLSLYLFLKIKWIIKKLANKPNKK